jgi:hypothetical protein
MQTAIMVAASGVFSLALGLIQERVCIAQQARQEQQQQLVQLQATAAAVRQRGS